MTVDQHKTSGKTTKLVVFAVAVAAGAICATVVFLNRQPNDDGGGRDEHRQSARDPRSDANRGEPGPAEGLNDTSVAGENLPTTETSSPPRETSNSPDSMADPLDTAFIPLIEMEPAEIQGLRATRENLRRPARLAKQDYPSALWVQPVEDHGVAQVGYQVAKRFRLLQGRAGIVDADADVVAGDDPPNGVFRIYGDGNLLWESPALSGFGTAAEFSVDASHVVYLVLTVESGCTSDQAQFVWADLQLTEVNQEASSDSRTDDP